jgi:predicted TIM-barrel fold metal-dependent hydrolase
MVEPIVKAQAGILKSSRQLGVDQAYEERLIGLIDSSSLDAVLLLAMDYPYDPSGNCLKEKAKFYVPNDHVLGLAKKYSQIIPACSIHPARKDAVEELERCAEKGAKVLKLLPNCHHVDCSDIQYQPFWEKLAKLGLPFLAHTGGEFSVPVLDAKFADPRILRLPLECGVKVIAAHGAGKSGIWDPDYTADLLKMMESSPICLPITVPWPAPTVGVRYLPCSIQKFSHA